jgi:hypothetical protein
MLLGPALKLAPDILIVTTMAKNRGRLLSGVWETSSSVPFLLVLLEHRNNNVK